MSNSADEPGNVGPEKVESRKIEPEGIEPEEAGQGKTDPEGIASRSLAKPGSRGGARTGARSARRRSRELAMQGLYQWLLSGESTGAIQAHIETSPGFERADRAHFETLLHGAIRDADELTGLILPYLDRELNHLSPVERATLMIGCYELLRHHEIPYRVVINEAVELAKSFGGTDGYKYVNGVLDKLAGSIRPSDAGSRQR